MVAPSLLGSLLCLENDLLSQLLQLVEVLLEVQLAVEHVAEENVELVAKLVSLPWILTVDKLLHLATEAIKRPSRLPSSHQISHDHFQPLSFLDRMIEAHAAHVHFEGSLDLQGLAIEHDHMLFLPDCLRFELFLDLLLLLQVASEVSLDLLSAVRLL